MNSREESIAAVCELFTNKVKELKEKGVSEKDICLELGIKNIATFRMMYAHAINEVRKVKHRKTVA